MPRPYKDALITATLKKNAEGTALVLDVPYRLYSEIIVMDGKRVRLTDLKNEGKEVLAKVMAVAAGQKRLQMQEVMEKYGINLESYE